MKLGTKIRDMRLSKGLRQVDLAERSGVTQVHISSIETGKAKDPCVSCIQKIASGLGCTIDELLKDVCYE